jgi:Cof subfamily protein (haloacid dehalogenase superfamily)
MSLRLLALDVDGTLTDSTGAIRPRVAEAVRRAQLEGLRVVPCTGRRYRTLRPVLEALEISGEVVVQNGVLVKQARDGRTLRDLYLEPSVYGQALDAMQDAGPPLVYVDEGARGLDIVTARTGRIHPFQAAYLDAMREVSREQARLDPAPPERTVVMMSWMADFEALSERRRGLASRLEGRARINLIRNMGHRGSILEVCHARSGKWSALRWIARRAGIADDEIAAIGDDTNDLEMIRHAGLGIAMGHAPDPVRAAATHITRSNDEDGLAHALDTWILPRTVGRGDARNERASD